MTRRTRARRLLVYGGLFLFVLMGLFLVGAAKSKSIAWPEIIGISTASVAVSVGEGFIVAALLGGFVDYRLKRELAEDIADLTASRTASVFFNDLLGGGARGLPDAYYQGMRNLAVTDVLALDSLATVEFLRNADDALMMRLSYEYTIMNVANESSRVKKPWILTVGSTKPSFDRYDIEVSRRPLREGELPVVTQIHMGPSAVSPITIDRQWSISLNLPIEDDERLRLPPQATASAHFSGTLGLPWEGVLPIVASCPTLKQSLRLFGDALELLDIWVQVGRDNDLRPTSTADSSVYDLGFGVQGTTTRLLWKKKAID